ncbi:MAG: glucose 1-dehydrogenase [Proteobacteria bacterium]|nr:glucose 1-dehydrogenase [Pseudomonadota bacterium]
MSAIFDLTGKVALVTGASSGLGRHMALTLARAGARVALAARRVDKLEALAAEIAAFDGRALPVAMDVTDSGSVTRAVAEAETELGGLAICVNNAGIALKEAVADIDDPAWAQTMATNLDGANRVARAAAAAMAAHGHGGSIVNIASILGLRPSARVPAYSAAKAAIISLTQSLALTLARDSIRVNAIAPGYVMTDLNRAYLQSPSGAKLVERVALGRFGLSGDLDGPLLLLASDAGRYMTGTTLVVDGGHTLAFL